MNKYNRFHSIITLSIAFFMLGNFHLFGQKSDFASVVKSELRRVEREAEKDPDTFKENIAQLEKDWSNRKDPVERSVVHAMLGSGYGEMKWTSITDFDEETRDHYDALRKSHFDHVFDDMKALAETKASIYSVLLTEKGKDDDLFNDDMLSVMVRFVIANAQLTAKEKADIYKNAADVYRQKGNLNGYGLMKLDELRSLRTVEVEQGGLTYSAYGERVKSLMEELKKEEVGADMALEYQSIYLWGDERIIFLRKALEEMGNSRRKADLRKNLDRILNPTVSMYGSSSDLMANRPCKMSLRFWNCEEANITVRQYVGRKKEKNGWGALLTTGDVVHRQKVKLAMDSAKLARKAQNLPVDGNAETTVTLPAGRYVMVAEGAGEESVGEFTVGSMRIVKIALSAKKCRLYVLDNETGRPLQGVKVQWRKKLPAEENRAKGWEDRNLDGEALTDANGMVELNGEYYARAVRSEQDYTEYEYNYNGRNQRDEVKKEYRCSVMTDRSIYRPGQTVKGALVLYQEEGDEKMVASGKDVELIIEDAKWKKLYEQELKTNDFGTASFEYALPADCEVGLLRLSVKVGGLHKGSESVRVEEYKRPTFDVKFSGHNSGHFGETLEAEGTAMMFAGVPVQGAQVHYTVSYASIDFKRWWFVENWHDLTEGELITDDAGKFRVPVALTEEHLTPGREVMRYRVKATVTDVNGESHDVEWDVNASNREFVLDLQMESVQDLSKDALFVVKAYDLNREKVTVSGGYEIRYKGKAVKEGTFTSGDSILLPQDLVLGAEYEVYVKAKEKSGKEVSDATSFRLYDSSIQATKVSQWDMNQKYRALDNVQEENFIYTEKDTYEKGGAVDIYFTTKETDAYIIYNVYNVDKVIDHQVGVTDGKMKHLHLPYQEEWGTGICVEVLYVRNGQYCSMKKSFQLAEPDKRLKMEWATFRDKLQPGQKEQWRLVVTKNDKRVSGAEMMAVLYDASLDLIYPHSWNFGLGYTRDYVSSLVRCSQGFDIPSFSLSGKNDRSELYRRSFIDLKAFEHDRYLMRAKGESMAFGMAENAEVMVATRSVSEPVRRMKGVPMLVDAIAVAEEGAEEISAKEDTFEGKFPVTQENFDQVTVRGNFEETAFFMPYLVSDAQGNVDIAFTLPESLTEWRFRGFAHTKDVDYGQITATAVARKEFMVRPNMPRFLRWGDEAVIASSIINQSEKPVRGTVRMRLINPVTDEVVLTQEKGFEAEAGKTVGVDFGFSVKEEWMDLDCEIIAMSGNVSDGEKNHLPVLSTKKEMVEAVPYYIIGKNQGAETIKTVDVGKLFNENSATATQRGLKIEYTDNPAWMCVEALCGVKNPTEDNAINFAASLYANTRIVQFMKVFPVLEKQENPAELQNRTRIAEAKLSELQNGDGGWSWFKGMLSSYYTTLTVCEQLAKIPNPNDRVKVMLRKGMEYLDKQALDTYEYQKKEKGKGKSIPHDVDTRYLYVSALMPTRPVSQPVQKMREEYLRVLEKSPRDLTIYGVANVAYTLRAFGHTKKADEFVDFLKDYTVEKPGQGRFYATDAAYYSWMDYRIPTQVAAMKAIRQKDKEDSILYDMQLWLISQKQVQKWDSPMNTIDVADFLLQVSPQETFHESKKPVLIVDGHELKDMDYGTINTERDQLEGREANLILQGNVLTSVPEEMLEDGVEQLEVRKQTPGISWGAAYATFLEDVGNLKLYATDELKIQRKLYVQKAGSSDWMDYSAAEPIKVGDKMRIRHIITADRDMDFVRVSAQHPACLEPLRQLSGYQRMGGRGCYLTIHDSHFDMFFDWFARGTSTLDMEYSIVREGCYQMGISTVECVYAKQFGGHTTGLKVDVKSAH